MKVGIAAYSGEPSSSLIEACRVFIARLASSCRDDIILIVGGYWGLMKCIVDEALLRGITVVILPPSDRDNHRFPKKATVISTGLDSRGRSVALARSSDVLVSLGGAIGTLLEILLAYSYGKPVYILEGTGLDTDRYKGLIDPYADSRRLAKITYVREPEKLAEEVCNLRTDR
jgi:uncharacterized protein (TIGR00725 family)